MPNLPKSFNEFYGKGYSHEQRRLRRAEMAKEVIDGGLSVWEVSAKHGVSAPTVRRGLYEAGYEAHQVPRKSCAGAKTKIICEILRNPNATFESIAEKVGCSKQFAHQVHKEIVRLGYLT